MNGLPDGAIPLAAPGWYTDPHDSARDRWWDGTAWTDRVHRAPRIGGLNYPAAFQRSMRAGANGDARIAEVAFRVAVIAVLLIIIGSAFLGLSDSEAAPGLVVALRVILVLGLAGGALSIVFGVRGMRAASRHGGFALSVWSIGVGSIVLLITGPLVFLTMFGGFLWR